MFKKVCRLRVIIPIVSLLVIAAGLIYAHSVISRSSAGTITAVSAAPKAPAASTTRTAVTDTYATFSYGNGLIPNATDPVVAPVLSSYSFTKKQFAPWAVSIQITSLPSQNLSDSGTYNYRNISTNLYTKTQRAIGPYTTTIFTAKDGSGQVIYFQKGGVLASVSMGGGTSEDSALMQTELMAIISGWRWL